MVFIGPSTLRALSYIKQIASPTTHGGRKNYQYWRERIATTTTHITHTDETCSATRMLTQTSRRPDGVQPITTFTQNSHNKYAPKTPGKPPRRLSPASHTRRAHPQLGAAGKLPPPRRQLSSRCKLNYTPQALLSPAHQAPAPAAPAHNQVRKRAKLAARPNAPATASQPRCKSAGLQQRYNRHTRRRRRRLRRRRKHLRHD